MSGSTETEWLPEGGWDAFERNLELVDAIWSGLSEANGEWHYMNFTCHSSFWESCADGSGIYTWYEREGEQRLIELRVTDGVASAYMAPLIEAFGLRPRRP